MDPTNLRNFKDFLQVYNDMSERCFTRCITSFNERELTTEEVLCTERCASKHINVNHKVMEIYMEIQPQMMNKRIQEMNEQQAALERTNETLSQK